jgi:TetR/AcrR family transcriptional repressor of nem operon
VKIAQERLLELGETLIRTRGFNAISYADLSRKLQVKNAAIHYHYPTKEDLGIAIIRYNREKFDQFCQHMIKREFKSDEQIRRYIRIYSSSLQDEKVCLVGSLGPDYATFGTAMQNELKNLTSEILDWFTQVLEQGRNEGIFQFKAEPQTQALLIITNLTSALILSKIMGATAFHQITDSVMSSLLKTQP